MFPVFPIEDQLLFAIQSQPSAVLDLLFRAITLLGNPAFWLFIAALLYWNNRERQSFFLVNIVVFSSAVTAALKIFFARPRPSELVHRVLPQDPISIMLEANTPQFGFPSGHSVTIAAVLAFFSKNKKKLEIALFAIIAVLVAFSRLYIGTHFPLDVIAGLALGVLIGIFALWIDKAFEKHEFRLSKLEDEIIVIFLIALGITAIALFDVPVLASSVLGYYAGFFFGKEAGLKQSEYGEKKWLLKFAIGITSVAIMLVLTLALYAINKQLALFFFFTNGFWVTYGFPDLFEKTMKKAKRFPAVEKLLK